MTRTIHRLLMTIGGTAAGIGGLIAMPDYDVLGIPSEVGAWMSLLAGVSIILANAIRANWGSEDA